MAAIDIELNVEGTEAATSEIGEFNAALGRTEGGVQRTGSGVSTFKGTLTGLGVAAGVVAAGVGGVTAAVVAFGNELERRSGIWNRFSGDLTNLRQRTGGLVTELQAMTVANELASRGIQVTGRDLNNILVAAIERSNATGQDFTSTVNRLNEAIGSGSAESLRVFGIALEAGVTGTEAQAAALDNLDERFGNVNSRADGAGGAIAVFTNALDDSQGAFMQAIDDSGVLNQAFVDLFNAVTGGSGTFEDAMKQMIGWARTFGAATAEVISRVTAMMRTNIQGWQALLSGDIAGAARAFGENLQHTFTNVADLANGNLGRAIQDRVGESNAANSQRTRGGGGARRLTGGGGGGRRSGGGGGDDPFDDLIGSLTEFRDFANEESMIRRELAQEEADANVATQLAALAKWNEAEEARTEKAATEGARRKALLERDAAEAREFQEKVAADSQNILQPAVAGLTDALSSVIAGSKSADEAFQGMLASFLEMIAQQAALEAAKEFAAAIGSFASYDYGAGALHLAAGAAWTGVAVASGAASIAVAPSAAEAPASPQASAGTQGGGGGNYTFNINGPVLSAGSKANLGRELGRLMGDGERRFGRAA